MQDQYGREPFQHPALEGLEGITEHGKATILDKRRVGGLAEHYGLDAVVRWKPKRVGAFCTLLWANADTLASR